MGKGQQLEEGVPQEWLGWTEEREGCLLIVEGGIHLVEEVVK